MEYCLIEKCPHNYIIPGDSIAVALTQEAIFSLECSGIKYITLEDFYTSGEISGDIDRFLMKQLTWLENFDDFLKGIFPEAKRMNINLASIYYYRIKFRVDNVVITSRILNRFLEKTKPSKVWFVSPQFNEDKIDHPLSFRNTESVYSRLIKSVCRVHGVNFQRLDSGNNKKADFFHICKYITKICSDSGELKRTMKKMVPKVVLKLRRNLINQLKKLYFKENADKFQSGKGRILFLNSCDYVNDFCNDAKKYGFEIFLKQKNRKKKLSWRSQLADIEMVDRERGDDNFKWSKVFNLLRKSKTIQWLNEQCGVDVYSVIGSRLEFFIKNVCPEIITKIKDYLRFYSENSIDFVATNMLWTVDDYAALEAARLSSTTKSIWFAHGADFKECKSRFFYLFRKFDLLFSFDKAEVEPQRNLVKLFKYPYPLVGEFPYFRKKYQREFSKINNRITNKKPTMIFIPIICSPWPNRVVDLSQPFPMEYVKWHRALAEYLSKRDDYYFIWKGFICPNQKFNLMDEIIRKKGYKNIKFNSGRLAPWFSKVDRVLTDISSTAFFEAIYSGLPTLSLCRLADQRLYENAHKEFGTSLQAYQSIREGIKIVEKFLDSKREKYIVTPSDTEISVLDTINSYLSLREKNESYFSEKREVDKSLIEGNV